MIISELLLILISMFSFMCVFLILENKLKIGHYLTVKLEIVDNKYRILNVSIVLPGMNFDDNILEDPSLDLLIPGMRLPCSVTSVRIPMSSVLNIYNLTVSHQYLLTPFC